MSQPSITANVPPEIGVALKNPTEKKRNVHFWFSIITLIYVMDIADRNVISVVLPAIKSDFGLTDASLGLIGSILYLSLGLLVVPTGILVDRWSRKYMIAIMVTLWSIATWCTGLAKSYVQLVTSRLFVGVGESGYNPAGYALIGAWYPERLRGRMVGIFNFGQALGTVVGMGIGGYLAHHFGWRSVFGVMAVPGFILAMLMLFAPDYKSKKVEAEAAVETKGNTREALRFIFKNRTILLLYLAQLPLVFFMSILATWAPTFFARQFDMNMAQVGTLMMVFMTIVCLGHFGGGYLSDRLVQGSPRGRVTAAMILIAVGAVAYTVGYGGAIAKQGFWLITVSLCIAQVFFAGHMGCLVTAGLDLVPPHYRGTCQSFIPLFQMLTAFWGSAVCGLISDRLGLPMALLITMLIGCGLGLALLLAAYRTYLADYEKQKALGTFTVEVG